MINSFDARILQTEPSLQGPLEDSSDYFLLVQVQTLKPALQSVQPLHG